MKFFQHFEPDYLTRKFVYRGLLFGWVPVYIGDLRSGCPDISVRNGVPELVLDVGEALYDAFCRVASFLGQDFDSYPITITGRLDGAALAPGELG